MYYLIFAICACVFTLGIWLCFKKVNKDKHVKIEKALALLFAVVFFVRYYFYFSAINIALICIGFITFNSAHIFWCATLDLMNPQNENYATGEVNDNPNERSATVIAFIMSAVYAFFSFILYSDVLKDSITVACIKLALIGIAVLGMIIYMYVTKIKVYYNEK